MKKIKIIIIGGGFGGVYTAKNLYKKFRKKADITIINRTNYFLFTPLLHEVATGSLTPKSVIESLREIFRGTSVKCIEDNVIEINKENKIVKTNNNSFEYDYLIVSAGTETNYFNIPGAQENSFTLKSLNDAIILRNHIIETFENAVKNNNENALSFAIVGAGATGIELATELAEYVRETLCSYYKHSIVAKDKIKISIITNTPQVLSIFPEKMRVIAEKALIHNNINIIKNATVISIEKGLIKFSDSNIVNANTIIWVAGVKPSIFNIKGIDIGPKGRMEINKYLQSINDQYIFGLGDASGTLPMLAQIAVQQAKTVANNIYAHNNKKSLEEYNTNIKGLLISLGKGNAAGDFNGITFSGPIMWFIWRTIYLFNFNSWKKRFEIVIEWTINLFYPRDITYLK